MSTEAACPEKQGRPSRPRPSAWPGLSTCGPTAWGRRWVVVGPCRRALGATWSRGVVVGSLAVSSVIRLPVSSFFLPYILHFFRMRQTPQWFNVGARKEGIRTSPDGHRICRGSVSNSSPMFFPLPFPRSPQSSWYACRGWAPVPRCLATSPFGYWLSVSDPFPSPPPGSPCPTPYRPRPALPLLGPALLWVRLQQTTRGSCWPF